MTRTRILLLTAALAAAALTGCNRDRGEEPAPGAAPDGAQVTPADAAAPLAFAETTEHAAVRLTLPEAVKPHPDLHARLYADEVRKLRQFLEGAQADRTEAGGDGGRPPYEKTVTFTPGAETGKLFSLKRTDFDWSGGAHPNTLSTGVLWDKALKRAIGPRDLFRRDADLTVLDQALCTATNKAKRDRAPDSPSVTLGGGDWSCPRAARTPFVLAASDEAGKAGGLTFLIGPYQVGPYAEGAYEITIPATVFRSALGVSYINEFGGAPTRVGDVTPSGDQS